MAKKLVLYGVIRRFDPEKDKDEGYSLLEDLFVDKERALAVWDEHYAQGDDGREMGLYKLEVTPVLRRRQP